MFSNFIMRLMELVYENEKVVDRMQENKCGGVYIDKYTWWRSFFWFAFEKKSAWISAYVKKKEKMMKEERKRHDRVLKVRIGGYKYKWKKCCSTSLIIFVFSLIPFYC